jgi:eukaryotic-like serine/threonine-protein kinase
MDLQDVFVCWSTPPARTSITLLATFMVGTTLKHYRIVRALGRGGMGDVYAAEDLELRRLVALKTLPAETASDPDRLHRFRREAQAVAALNHPNIVTLYGVEEANGVHFLTMELVEGRTLADLIPPGGLPLRQLLEIAVPLADAVRAAHERGVVHRDLKPANVMVNTEGRVKVLDFGLAKNVGGPEARANAEVETASQLTAQFQVVGTAAYMSPEQAQGRAVDARSDIFSLGVVLYEMAVGARPFVGASVVDVMSAIVRDTPPAPSQVNAAVPLELDRAIRRCLAKDPDRRYQTATDLRNDLEDLQQQVSSGAAPVLRRTSVWQRHRRAMTAATIGLILLVSAGAAIYWRTAWFGGSRPAPTRFEFTQLTTQSGVEWFPSLSPDGQWVVYAGDSGGQRHIYMQSTGGQNPLDISGTASKADDDQPAFSPDGQHIAFRSSREGGGLFVMGRTGEAIKKVSPRGSKPAWSPDGKRLAFTLENVELNPQNSLTRSELWTVDVDTEKAGVLYAGDAAMPSWSPHDRRIAFTSRIGPPLQVDIWTIPVTGGKPTPVTNDVATDWNPAWSPDGRYLYFSSDRDGSMNLWRVRIDESSGGTLGEPEPLRVPGTLAAHASISADGTRLVYTSALLTNNIQRLAFDPVAGAVKGDPTWVTSSTQRFSSPDPSPDGQWVAFYSLERPNGDLYLARPDGSEFHALTTDPAIDRLPRWSPDGQWVACFSTRSGLGRSELWKIRPDGSGLQQMTEEGAGYFAWAPDGLRIAAAAGAGVQIFDPSRAWKEQTPERHARVVDDPQGTFIVNSWSRDGTRLVGQAQGTVTGLVMYTLATRTSEKLAAFGEWPVFLPDSRRVLFVASGHGFYILDTKSKEMKPPIYSVTPDVIGPPRLTRDGTAMYYSRRHTEADIWLMTRK